MGTLGDGDDGEAAVWGDSGGCTCSKGTPRACAVQLAASRVIGAPCSARATVETVKPLFFARSSCVNARRRRCCFMSSPFARRVFLPMGFRLKMYRIWGQCRVFQATI